MSLWFGIGALFILGMIYLVLTGIRDAISDGVKMLDSRLQEIEKDLDVVAQRLDELCQPQRSRD
jgi:hypothetical protein